MSIIIKSPFKGKIVPIEQVEDIVFSQKMLGDGVAVLPEEGVVLAPLSEEISAMPASGHAFGMIIASGIELLVHVGIDTVDLNGQGFEVLIQNHQRVEVGQPVIRFDRSVISDAGLSLVSPVVATGCRVRVLAEDYVDFGEPLLEILGEDVD